MDGRQDGWAVATSDLALWTWSAPHPDDGAPVAHLLVTPRPDGLGAAVQDLALGMGLGPVRGGPGVPTAVPVERAWGAVAPTDRLPLFVLFHAGQVVGRRVDRTWRAAANARRVVVLTVGTEPAPDDGSTTATGADVDVPAYVRRTAVVFHGLLALS